MYVRVIKYNYRILFAAGPSKTKYYLYLFFENNRHIWYINFSEKTQNTCQNLQKICKFVVRSLKFDGFFWLNIKDRDLAPY